MSRDKRFPSATKSGRRFLCLAILALVPLLGVQGAWARCVMNKGYTEKVIMMDIGNVVVPNDLPVGAPIIPARTFSYPQHGPNNKPWNCLPDGGWVIADILNVGAEVTNIGQSKVFATAVPGVGIRLSRVPTDPSRTAEDDYFDQHIYPHTRYVNPDNDLSSFQTTSLFQLELFKTELVTGNGPIGPPGIYTEYYGAGGPKQSVLTTKLGSVGITIITSSCTVDLGSKNISVDFGKVPQSNFTGRGSTTGERKFNIGLNCRASPNTQNTVYLRMDATPDASNEQGVLKIAQTGSPIATGVGIQVVNDKSMPVKFGEDVVVGPSMNGSYVLPYTARYFQTGDKVTTGRANGTATFTLSYK